MSKTKTNLKFQNQNYVGRHFILEFWGCRQLNQEDFIVAALKKAVRDCGATLLKLYAHQFKPQGVTAVAIIAESHISVHTWPELEYAAFDIFTCGTKVKPQEAVQSLKKSFKPKNILITEIKRGVKI